MSDASSVFNVSFKLVVNDSSIPVGLNGLTFHYDIDFSNNIHNFMNNINYNIKQDFGLSTFEVIPHQFGENGQDIKQYLMKTYEENYERIKLNEVISADTGFYVRPISLTEEDRTSIIAINERMRYYDNCPVCLTRREMTRQFACEHEICYHCFVSWNTRMEREDRPTTCPICRGV